jgi:hypothetical protein
MLPEFENSTRAEARRKLKSYGASFIYSPPHRGGEDATSRNGLVPNVADGVVAHKPSFEMRFEAWLVTNHPYSEEGEFAHTTLLVAAKPR